MQSQSGRMSGTKWSNTTRSASLAIDPSYSSWPARVSVVSLLIWKYRSIAGLPLDTRSTRSGRGLWTTVQAISSTSRSSFSFDSNSICAVRCTRPLAAKSNCLPSKYTNSDSPAGIVTPLVSSRSRPFPLRSDRKTLRGTSEAFATCTDTMNDGGRPFSPGSILTWKPVIPMLLPRAPTLIYRIMPPRPSSCGSDRLPPSEKRYISPGGRAGTSSPFERFPIRLL